jgi:hypothetical protein
MAWTIVIEVSALATLVAVVLPVVRKVSRLVADLAALVPAHRQLHRRVHRLVEQVEKVTARLERIETSIARADESGPSPPRGFLSGRPPGG